MSVFSIDLFIKAAIGGLIVVLIEILSSSKNYYIAALVPLFPFFGLIAYYIVGTQRGVQELKNTIIFGMLSLIPYLVFLIALYFFIKILKVEYSLMLASAAWLFISIILVIVWNNYTK